MPTASAIVERLVRHNLLGRSNDPAERRRVLLTVTPSGAWHLAEAREAALAHLAEVFARLPAVERLRIAERAVALRKAIKEAAAQMVVLDILVAVTARLSPTVVD